MGLKPIHGTAKAVLNIYKHTKIAMACYSLCTELRFRLPCADREYIDDHKKCGGIHGRRI